MSHSNGKIFVLYPRGLRTGGPEALHQLVDMLRELGQDAYLVPHQSTTKEARVQEYDKYNAPECPFVADSEENTVVVPELYVSYLAKVKNATPICWWLSIDYSPSFAAERTPMRVAGGRVRVASSALVPWLKAVKNGVEPYRIKNRRMTHVVQSSYAWAFLFSRLNVVPSMLSDYTPSLDKSATRICPDRNPSLVAFNPLKGGHLVRQIMKVSDSSIEWRAIENMTRLEVGQTLLESGIYLDLGFHPGKDRMPREAALAGALTVVGRRGAGAYFSDVPIPWEHKISPGPGEVREAAALLPQLIANLPTQVSKQDSYRRVIQDEKSRFRREVHDIFIAKQLGKDALDYS